MNNVYNISQKEEDKKKILNNIVFYQLGLIAEMMNNFILNRAAFAEIVNKHACKNELRQTDIDVLVSTITGKKEKETNRVLTVQRGIPAWLQELEGNAATIAKRNPKHVFEFLTQDKNL